MARKMYNIVRIFRVARPNRISKYYTNKNILNRFTWIGITIKLSTFLTLLTYHVTIFDIIGIKDR